MLHTLHNTTPAPRQREETTTLRAWVKPVHYRWSTPDGSVHSASSVVLARSRSGLKAALKQFWITNAHVSPARSADCQSAVSPAASRQAPPKPTANHQPPTINH
jgi:hypothetical protein